MSETPVDFYIKKLKEKIKEDEGGIGLIKEAVNCFIDELMHAQAFVKDVKRNVHSEIVKNYVKGVTTEAIRAENLIDRFLISVKLRQKRKVIGKIYHHIYRDDKCNRVIRSLGESLRKSRRAAVLQVGRVSEDTKHSTYRAPVTEEDEVVGFDEEVEEITKRLLGGSADMEVIPIVGMLGLGKTTLARKIFKNPRVELAFDTRIWIYASQVYNRRDLLLNIISQLTGNTEHYQHACEYALADVIRNYLLEAKYLIVLDDIWTLEAFNDVKSALPDNLKGSRLLLTTRDSTLANRCCNNSPHHLKFLTDSECWELLQKKIFLKDKYPQELEELGKDIAMRCGGLPLATLVIAGILTAKGKTKSEWERVKQGVGEHIIRSDIVDTKKLVRMSCDSLPFNLKVCFLYCSVFPRGSRIPARKIVLLWIAEGFIGNPEKSNPETLAEEYLNELVSKNLLMVTQRASNGQIKACRMHDMLHEFCKQEASEEIFFKEIKLGVKQSFPRNQELATFRGFCIESSVEEFISTKPCGDSIQSFLCFSSQEIKNDLGTIPKSFPLLRVFETESISFPKFHKKFFQLYHFRYIAVSSSSLKVLPKFMEDLWNLQTLIILTQQKTLEIEADIWKMSRLRHFHTNASAKLHPSAAVKSKKHVVEAHALQTLSTIEPESCTEHVLARCQNLKKLGIRGKKAQLVWPFVNANNLKCLEKLKLMNDYPLEVGKLHLPLENIFPMSLKEVTLSGTKLEWTDMVKLELLPAIEVLKLKDHAFTGDYWESKDGAFTCLKVLWIERTDLVTWKASSGAFRSLERLVLHHLDKLEEVPIELSNISNLQVIELKNTTRTVVESAKKIQAKREGIGLKLSINLPDL